MSFELFAGLLALSVALDSMSINVVASYFSEICPDCCLVAATNFPAAINIGDIKTISRSTIAKIVKQWPHCWWILGAGPPCQDVSLLNSSATGSWGSHSSLREEYKRIYHIILEFVPYQFVFSFMECTKMTANNRQAYDQVYGSPPVEICSAWACHMTRPRLWWFNRDIPWHEFAEVVNSGNDPAKVHPPLQRQPIENFLEKGWLPADRRFDHETFSFRCFTRSTPRSGPMKDPRGIDSCDSSTLERWKQDFWAQSPYQYKQINMVESKGGKLRRLIALEEERLMGFPAHFTAPLLQLKLKDFEYEHRRRSLLGNSWCVFVIVFILQCMGIDSAQAPVSPVETQNFFPADCFQDIQAELCGAMISTMQDIKTAFPRPHEFVPFSQTLSEPVPDLLGPDSAELWATQSCSTVSGVQARHQGFAVTRQRLIPAGLPPNLHAVMSSALQSPLDSLPVLPDDLQFACNQVLCPDYPAWLKKQQRRLAAIILRGKRLRQRLLPFRSNLAMATCPNVDPHVILLLTYLMQWPDRGLALLPTVGAPIVGHIPSAQIFRHSDKTATVTMDKWMESADEWNRSLVRRSPPSAEQAEAVWVASIAEQAEGTLGSWYTYEDLNAMHGQGQWRAMIRFGIQQGEKWRCIDNGRSGNHNETVSSADRIHTTSIDVAMAITAFLYANDTCRPRRPHTRATKDMRKAYRQIPVFEQHAQFQIIAVWHVELRCYRFAHLRGLAFGLYASVSNFNRIPSFLVAVARRFLGIPAIAYFDDIRLQSVVPHGQLVWDAFGWLVETIGYVFDPSKDVPMHPQGVFLGFNEDLSWVHSQGIALLTPKQGFLDGIVKVMRQALSSGTMQHGDARSLRGRLLHLSNSMVGRVGRGQTHAVEHLLQSDSVVLPPSLITCLEFFLQLIELRPWRIFRFQYQPAVDFVIYTDAAASGEGLQQLVTLSFVVMSSNFCRAAKAEMPFEMLDSFENRATYIAQGEAMACLFCMWHMREWLHDVSVIHFIDNLGVLSAMCSGSSNVCDISHIVSATLAIEAALGMRSWKEHVDSKANLADCGTKDVADYVTALNIDWEILAVPPWPADVAQAPSSAWISWFKENQTTAAL